MSVPGRVEAASLLLSLDPPSWFLRHSCAVAEVAGWLAARSRTTTLPVDRPLVEGAALLHDVDKLVPQRDDAPRASRAPHGEGSAGWLAAQGHPELGPAVSAHAVTRLLDPVWFARWTAGASIEERIVAYADKRAGQRLEPMERRFASWARRYPVEPRDGSSGAGGSGARGGANAGGGIPDGWTRDAVADVRARAKALEKDVCSTLGVAPADVRRLRWTGAALAAARARR